MSRDWRLYIGDMIRSCDRILQYSRGLAREEFERHEMAYDAIVRNLGLLGEAARQIPLQVRERTVGVEWPKIIALRNILIHGYFGVDDDILWDVVMNRVSALRSSLSALEHSAD